MTKKTMLIRIYRGCVKDIIKHEKVRSMESYIAHHDVDTLAHSLFVSYWSFLICRKLKMNYRLAARGALLHDFYLYDWHIPNIREGLHGFTHPATSLTNAKKYFKISKMEEDIIIKHMWPLTIFPPKYRETYVVIIVDKVCAILETLKIVNGKKLAVLKQKVLKI
ncbi:HD family phosphohydrolase [Petrocella sp. FN5]|uniref:HD family phosphohydrolase n=1 Tax=Petrocella sp. FN5 TaxID=3032002 RepID=UPI0023DBE9C6|nr:HD family phosphohydrolase [Petrocella sp. FN5]MDF1617195.1 HD family phosphohydrolase [Petrocella sp. FN5]